MLVFNARGEGRDDILFITSELEELEEQTKKDLAIASAYHMELCRILGIQYKPPEDHSVRDVWLFVIGFSVFVMCLLEFVL